MQSNTIERGKDSLMGRLREDTRSEHDAAESHGFTKALAGGTLPREQYVAMLEQFRLIFVGLENELRNLARRNPAVADLVRDEHFQEQNLAADLAFFGAAGRPVVALPATKAFLGVVERLGRESSSALLGVWYVFEGSKNGGKFIAKAVRGAYRLAGDDGVRYLDPHGARQRELWSTFRERMDAIPMSAADHEMIVEAAKTTFNALNAVHSDLLA